MARGFYCPFPFDIAMDPSVLRLKASKWGMAGVGCYYELRLMYGRAIQAGGHVTTEEIPGIAFGWRMSEDDVVDLLGFMAECGLIDASMWAEGLVGINDVAEDANYRRAKSDAGRASGESRRAKNKSRS